MVHQFMPNFPHRFNAEGSFSVSYDGCRSEE
jgi:hypothetical protein